MKFKGRYLIGIGMLMIAVVWARNLIRLQSVKPGQVWVETIKYADPFREPKKTTNIVLEVKGGYVKYKELNGILPYWSMRTEFFVSDSELQTK